MNLGYWHPFSAACIWVLGDVMVFTPCGSSWSLADILSGNYVFVFVPTLRSGIGGGQHLTSPSQWNWVVGSGGTHPFSVQWGPHWGSWHWYHTTHSPQDSVDSRIGWLSEPMILSRIRWSRTPFSQWNWLGGQHPSQQRNSVDRGGGGFFNEWYATTMISIIIFPLTTQFNAQHILSPS